MYVFNYACQECRHFFMLFVFASSICFLYFCTSFYVVRFCVHTTCYCFKLTYNGVIFDVMRQNTAEWLPGVRLRDFSTTCACSTQRIVRVGGCPVVVAPWQSTGDSRQVFKFPSNCRPFRFVVVPKSIKNFFVPV